MKNVLMIVTGSISCYKALDVISSLKKEDVNVKVILTEGAKKFVTPLLFESICGHEVPSNTFDEIVKGKIQHIDLANEADVIAIVPATANIIGKIAHGIADDLATSTAMASTCPLIIAPAMNTNMYNNKIVQNNLTILKDDLNAIVIEPASGKLACGAIGKGKLQNVKIITKKILNTLGSDIKSELRIFKVIKDINVEDLNIHSKIGEYLHCESDSFSDSIIYNSKMTEICKLSDEDIFEYMVEVVGKEKKDAIVLFKK